MEDIIKQFLDAQDFDIRKTGNSRFTDQKCLPDVVCAVSECILDFVKENPSRRFTMREIWKADYSSRLVKTYFSKPDVKAEDTSREYDKFFGQPIKMLASAGVLTEYDVRPYEYQINRLNILEYISMRERNAMTFLNLYLSKVMADSGMMVWFDIFFTKQDKASLVQLTDKLDELYYANTEIRNEYEPPRIYNRIINILAFCRFKMGIVKGRLSNGIISIDELRYNRVNWRDTDKPKNVTRSAYIEQNEEIFSSGGYRYAVEKAKTFVKSLHPYSEVHRLPAYPATHAHHIFPANEFPELADFPENLICLTPNQHYYFAHPDNHTNVIDKHYQLVCLVCKLDTIEYFVSENRDEYSLEDFKHVLNVGFDTDAFNDVYSFEQLKYQIMKHSGLQLIV